MTDWVHCNKCFHLPGSGKRFLLTSCGHIYCSDCIVTGTPMKCQICGNSCTTINLSSQMKPDVELYFTETQELLKKSLKQLQQVISFQNGHRIRLAAYHRQQINQIGKMKEEMKASTKFLKELEREGAKLKEENFYLKQFLSKETRPTRSENHQNSLQPKMHRNPTPPNRITVRTPPVNGHIGIIPRTPQSYGTPSTPANSERSMSSITPTNLTPPTPKIGSDGKQHSIMRYSPYSTQMAIRSMSSITPTNLTPPTNKLESDGKPHSVMKYSPYSTQMAFSNSQSRETSPNSSSARCYSGSPSNSVASQLTTSFHRPIQLRQEFRHPGLVRKATVSPYSPQHRSEALRSEE